MSADDITRISVLFTIRRYCTYNLSCMTDECHTMKLYEVLSLIYSVQHGCWTSLKDAIEFTVPDV